MMNFSPYRSSQEKSSFYGRLLFFLFPPKCAVCGEVGYGLLCPHCENELKAAFSPQRFLSDGGNAYADTMTCLFPYRIKSAKRLILLWKRLDHPDLSLIFAPYFKSWYRKQKQIKTPLVVTYLPRRKESRWLFGLDQAEKIAVSLAETLYLPMEQLLYRHGFSKRQHSLPRDQRQANVAGAFRPKRQLTGEVVLLVDDIVTTGASAKEAARVLKKAGAQKVFVLSIAH